MHVRKLTFSFTRYRHLRNPRFQRFNSIPAFGLIAEFVLAAWVTAVPCAHANSLAIFRTTFGEMAVELFDDDKPVTVKNFILLTELGRYQNNFFHVCAAGNIVQGGGFRVADPLSTNPVLNVTATAGLGTITNEFSVGTLYSNVFGTISMAKVAGFPDSASTDWFINLGDNSASYDHTNGGYTVFGRVIAGSNVLHQFNTRSNMFGTVNLGMQFSLLPVTYIGNFYPRYVDLVYSRVEILKLITIPQSNGSRLLAWNSPSTLVCRVEYSDTGIGGAWDLLHETNGNGNIQSAVDTNVFAETRLYRIRVE